MVARLRIRQQKGAGPLAQEWRQRYCHRQVLVLYPQAEQLVFFGRPWPLSRKGWLHRAQVHRGSHLDVVRHLLIRLHHQPQGAQQCDDKHQQPQ